MGAFLNITCFGGGGNTGLPTCDPKPELIKMAVLLNKGKRYTAAQINSVTGILPLLIADAKAVNFAARIFPILEFQAMEVTSEDRVQQSGGYGTRRTVRRGKISWNFEMWGGKCLHTALMGFDDKAASYDVILVDENGVVIGNEYSDGSFGGFTLSDLFIGDFVLPDGSNGTMWNVAFELSSSKQWNETAKYIGTNNAFEDLRGLRNLELYNATAIVLPEPAAGTFWIEITTDCGSVNLADVFPTELILAGNYTVKNATDLTTIPVTSRAIDTFNGKKYVKFILDVTSPNWVVGEDVQLCVAPTNTLESNGIVGYEANPVCIILPNS